MNHNQSQNQALTKVALAFGIVTAVLHFLLLPLSVASTILGNADVNIMELFGLFHYAGMFVILAELIALILAVVGVATGKRRMIALTLIIYWCAMVADMVCLLVYYLSNSIQIQNMLSGFEQGELSLVKFLIYADFGLTMLVKIIGIILGVVIILISVLHMTKHMKTVPACIVTGILMMLVNIRYLWNIGFYFISTAPVLLKAGMYLKFGITLSQYIISLLAGVSIVVFAILSMIKCGRIEKANEISSGNDC